MAHALPHIIQDLSLILGSAAITTLIFRKLKQPLVLGYIITGLLVGPEIKILPTVVDNESIKTWANIGVIFLLFSLGLDFSFKKLVKVGGSASVTAFTEIIIIVFAGYYTGRLMGWKTIDCIFLGGMLASSSTTIIIRAFDELKVKTQKFARTVFGVLIVEDIVVILILVLLPTIAISQQFQGSELFGTVLKLVFFLLLWFIAGIFLVPTLLRMAKKLIDNETLLILVIGLCFAMVVLATNVGFSAELGAFIMGSIFAETTKAERIEHVVKPVKDLFGAIFFVSIGMMINLQSMWDHIIPILIITLLTIVGKMVATTLGALISGQQLRHSVRVGMSMAQIGEFAFIIATLGITLNVTSSFLFPVAVGVSVITTFTTPYMIKYADPFYELVNRMLPGKMKAAIDQYASYSQSAEGSSQWQKVIKSYFEIVIINGVILLAIIILSTEFLLPFISVQFESDLIAQIVTLTVVLFIMLPFVWAMAIKKPNVTGYDQLFYNRKYSWAPILVMNTCRVLLTFLLLWLLLDRIFEGWLAVAIALASILMIFLVFRQRIQKMYAKIERRFLANLNEREASSAVFGISPSGAAAIPWDVHLAEYEVHPLAKFAGRTLESLGWREKYGINIALIQRGETAIYAPTRNENLFPNDKIYVIGTDDQLEQINPELEDLYQVVSDENDAEHISLQKIILNEQNPLVNHSIRESGVREKTKGLVIGIERGKIRLLNPESTEVFRAGDTVWLVGDNRKIKELKKEVQQ